MRVRKQTPKVDIPNIVPHGTSHERSRDLGIRLFETAMHHHLVVIGDLEQVTKIDVKGALVKLAPTIKASARAQFDGAALAKTLRARGARGVTIAPKVIADAVVTEKARRVATAPTTRAAIEAWFHELVGIDETERTDAMNFALAMVDQEGL
jgi:hypothetical protein